MRLILLLGDRVAHSRSPALHNAAFAQLGLAYTYVPCEVRREDLPAAVAGMRALGVAGANVTIPHKEAVIPLLDTLSEVARGIGAVNTLVRRETPEEVQLHGDNTDVGGFLDSLGERLFGLRGEEALVWGAGGAARAVVYALLTQAGLSRLTLVARRTEQADALAHALSPFDPGGTLRVLPAFESRAAVRTSHLLVNTTPLGMEPGVEVTPWENSRDFSPGQLIYDLIYAPRQTRLLRDAAEAGAEVMNGMAMLGAQASRAFALWTGQPIPPALLRSWALALG